MDDGESWDVAAQDLEDEHQRGVLEGRLAGQRLAVEDGYKLGFVKAILRFLRHHLIGPFLAARSAVTSLWRKWVHTQYLLKFFR